MLRGITSWGPGDCGLPKKPSVYIRPYSYLSWIEQHTGSKSGTFNTCTFKFGAWLINYINNTTTRFSYKPMCVHVYVYVTLAPKIRDYSKRVV